MSNKKRKHGILDEPEEQEAEKEPGTQEKTEAASKPVEVEKPAAASPPPPVNSAAGCPTGFSRP